MTLAIFDVDTYPPRYPDSWSVDRPVVVAAFAGGGAEQRSALLSRSLRRYAPSWRRTSATYTYIRDFLEARGYSLESFLWRDLRCYERTGVALGTAVTSQVEFEIPTAGQYGGDYPIDDAHVVVYEDGTETLATVTVDVDARTFTLDTAPGAGVVMTADYHYRRRVRLDSLPRFEAPAHGSYLIALELQEVPYDA